MSKILYVEDNEDNIYMLKMRLERKGYELLIAKDGEDGVNQAKEHVPNLIIMDVGLPVMDGYEATKLIKGFEGTKHIPIIILTAHALSTEVNKSKDSGADDFETKPVNISNLLVKIDHLIKKL
jgi:two-component system cell cycle response regulator DivK